MSVLSCVAVASSRTRASFFVGGGGCCCCCFCSPSDAAVCWDERACVTHFSTKPRASAHECQNCRSRVRKFHCGSCIRLPMPIWP